MTKRAGHQAPVAVDWLVGEVLSLELRLGRADPGRAREQAVEERAERVSVDPGHLGRDGEWW